VATGRQSRPRTRQALNLIWYRAGRNDWAFLGAENMIDIMAKLSYNINIQFGYFDGAKPYPSGWGSEAPLSINPEQTPGFRAGRVEGLILLKGRSHG